MCSFGSSQASAPSSQFSTSTVTADPRAAAMYGQAFGAAQQAAARPFTPYSYDPSAFVAPLNQVQLQATRNIMGYQGAADPYYQMGAGLAGAAGTTTAPQVVGQYMSPYMSQVIDPTRQAIEQQQAAQRSGQQAEQIKAGAFGQERGQLMRAVLAGQQNLGLGQALSPLYQTGYGQALGAAQSDLQRQLQAGQVMGGLGAGYQTAGLQGAEALMGAGSLGQQTQQKGLESLYNQFLMQQAYPFQTAQYLASVAGALGPQYGSTTSGLQSSMQPLSYMGMPMSDRRLKEGVDDEKSEPEVIGQTHDGKNIYRYRLINPDTGELGPVQIGLMADEVEETDPDAVGNYNGYRTLDYERATDDAARMGGGVIAGGDYATGGSVYGGTGYVPSVGLGASAGLQPARLSYMEPEQKKKYGLGDIAKDILGLYGAGKELYGDYKGIKSSLFDDHKEKDKAAGGAVEDDDVSEPKSYVPDTTLEPGKGLEPAKLSFMEPEQEKKTDYLGMAKDVGQLALMAAKAIPFVASLSDPRLKTGVRPHAADGIAVDERAADSEEKPDDFERAVTKTFKFEGGLNPDDVGHGPSMYGINQAAHPGIDVTKITPEQAKQIYRKEYWEGVGADKLPPNVREMVYDTAVMAGPHRANQLLKEAGTDPESYMAAREKFLSGLVASNPEKYGPYAKAWSARNAALRGGVGAPAAYSGSEEPTKSGGLAAIENMLNRQQSSATSRGSEPRGISGFVRGEAPEGAGEKALDFLTSERFLVPLLAGVGTAASSQSRFLAPALLQGLGAGAKTYAEMGQQEFERERAKEALGLEARKVGTSERELGLKELEMRRRLAGASAVAKALSGGAGEIPYAASKPTTGEAKPVEGGAPRVEAGGMPSASSDFWANVDPQSNPHVLNATAQRFENAAVAAGQSGDPEYAKQLLANAQQYRAAANAVSKEGRVLTKSGEVALIPGVLETEKQKARSEAETKAETDLVDVQPKPGGPTYKMTRKEAREMGSKEVAPGAGAPPGGSVPQGAILSKQPAWTEDRIKEMRKDERAMVDSFKQRQIAKERIDALTDSLRILQTGKFAEQKAEAVATLRSMGFDVPNAATANPAEFQKFIKNSTKNVFDEVKGLGGRILVSEIAGLTKANANPELQPEANAALLGQAKGLLDYEDRHFEDYSNWRKENPDAYDATDFERQWVKTNPLSKFAKEAEMRVGARGAPLLPIEQRQPGYIYTNEFGVTAEWTGDRWKPVGERKQ